MNINFFNLPKKGTRIIFFMLKKLNLKHLYENAKYINLFAKAKNKAKFENALKFCLV